MSVRKRNRLRGYDYSDGGAYFLTVCTKDRAKVLGVIENGQMIFSEYGKIIADEIIASCKLRQECRIDKFVIMPNHIHMILIIRPSSPYISSPASPVGADGNPPAPASANPPAPARPDRRRPSQNNFVSSFVRGFKGATSRAIGFSIWQRSFHDHIIRNQYDYYKIAQYIENNPMVWENDCFNRPVDDTGGQHGVDNTGGLAGAEIHTLPSAPT